MATQSAGPPASTDTYRSVDLTVAGGTFVIGSGTKLTDTAVLSGGFFTSKAALAHMVDRGVGRRRRG